LKEREGRRREGLVIKNAINKTGLIKGKTVQRVTPSLREERGPGGEFLRTFS
jgi:hypothetical protein